MSEADFPTSAHVPYHPTKMVIEAAMLSTHIYIYIYRYQGNHAFSGSYHLFAHGFLGIGIYIIYRPLE